MAEQNKHRPLLCDAGTNKMKTSINASLSSRLRRGRAQEDSVKCTNNAYLGCKFGGSLSLYLNPPKPVDDKLAGSLKYTFSCYLANAHAPTNDKYDPVPTSFCGCRPTRTG
eukprot:2382980-Lingulodinium_polyedra.AAC.1